MLGSAEMSGKEMELARSWTGSYTCQGKQWFRVRLHSLWTQPATEADTDTLGLGIELSDNKASRDGGTGPEDAMARAQQKAAVTRFTGLLIFRHREADGIYSITGELVGDQISIRPTSWLHKPPGFLAIGMGVRDYFFGGGASGRVIEQYALSL